MKKIAVFLFEGADFFSSESHNSSVKQVLQVLQIYLVGIILLV